MVAPGEASTWMCSCSRIVPHVAAQWSRLARVRLVSRPAPHIPLSDPAEGTPMRAVRYHDHGGPEQLLVEDIDRPGPGDGEVLVKVRAASVNPVDTYFR